MIFHYIQRTVGEVSDVNGQPVSHPTNIPSSATVYINDIKIPLLLWDIEMETVFIDGVQMSESITPSGYVVPQPYLVQGVSQTTM